MPLISPTLPSNWYTAHLSETDSTMLRLQEPGLATRPEEFVLLTADYQTAGHGQRGTHWEADAGQNLLFGILLHPTGVAPAQQFGLSEALALAVAEGLDVYTGGICVKWPNDIYWHDRKICGMLLEHKLQGPRIDTTLTGVGLNVNQRCFRGEAPNPVSLRQILGHDTDRTGLLEQIARNFERNYRLLQQGEYARLHRIYLRRLYRRGGFHWFRDGDGLFEGQITDVSPVGRISISRHSGELRSYAFKEVAFVINSSSTHDEA